MKLVGIRWLFAGIGVLILASTVLTFLSGQSVIRANEELLEARITLQELTEMLSTLKDAETGQRGYLLTGEAEYLAPYDAAVRSIRNELDILEGAVKAGKLSRERVARIRQLAERKLGELAGTIALRKERGVEGAVMQVRTGVGKATMDEIRTEVGDLQGEVQEQLMQYSRRVETLTMMRTATFVLTAGLCLGFVGWTYRRLGREMGKRAAAAEEMERQHELLQVTLGSIGDAVVVTDTRGCVTFMNTVAETLTEWPLKDATGTECSEVFKIVNEQSREKVESPVDKVLRLGTIVGLANHTILISRTGKEMPIDDSGAPIREKDGTVRGVVLVFRDFSEHKHAEKAMLAAKLEAETANHAKDQFLAALSHELRTPLTPVLVTLGTWEADGRLPEPLLEDVRMMRRNVELEARLIDDLLDVTRIAQGKLLMHFEVMNLQDLVNSAVEIVRLDFRSKELKLVLNLEAERPYVEADSGRMLQVLWNLLKNAAKFTPERGTVTVSLRNPREGEVELVVEDSGMGMTADMIARAFRPFEQAREYSVQRFGGLGLGLTISKALVEAHRGQISAHSEGANRGARFVVTLPTTQNPVSKEEGDEAELKVVTAKRSLSILLVEDHVDTATAMARLLKGLGHEVQVAHSVAGALTLGKECSLDLIFSDIGLPDGTGIGLLGQLRSYTKAPAIALTGFGMEEDISRCLEAGFVAHLTKPISFQRLQSVLQRVAVQ